MKRLIAWIKREIQLTREDFKKPFTDEDKYRITIAILIFLMAICLMALFFILLIIRDCARDIEAVLPILLK